MNIIYHHRTRSTDAQRIHIREIVRGLEELGHQVEVVSLVPTETERDNAHRDAGDAWWKKLVRHIPVAYEFVQLGYNAVGIPLLFWRILQRRPAFLYERYSLFNFTGVLAARLWGVPIVLEVNSPFALEQVRDRDIHLHRFAQWTEKVICNLATRVIVVSTPLREIMTKAGIRPEKIEVMTNGVRLQDFESSPADPELRCSLGLENRRPVIGFVGWFRRWHGIEMLVDAFQASGLRDRGARVMLIGDGQAMAELRQYVDGRGLRDSVIFTGPLPHASIPRYLDLVDIAVQPAANEYCCPMKILEYMALRKPIVAPRQQNIVELLRENEEARFFTPGDTGSLAEALRKMAEDTIAARRMGEAARQAITTRRYVWSENAKRIVEMLEPRLNHARVRRAEMVQPNR
jgi:glycosyltransferase involved in cell wall biosynthesis